ncbi:hypothetical protein FQA39_LY17084 [Lamprigera yunnana]|nr:hypothetical protein FQA39_LY17084 [Lamprigera yunnana]
MVTNKTLRPACWKPKDNYMLRTKIEAKGKGKNFTAFDKNFLVDLVQSKISIIENKKSDIINSEQKARAWDEIQKSYNGFQQTGFRTAKQIKEVYEVVKRNAQKKIWLLIETLYKTGGGTYISASSDLDRKIIAATKDQFIPDNNPLDSSADLLQNNDVSQYFRLELCASNNQIDHLIEEECIEPYSFTSPVNKKKITQK